MLKRLNGVFKVVSGLLAGIMVASQSAWSLDLVRDSKPLAKIVVAEDAGQYQKWAAGWLQDYIAKGTGANLEIITEGKAQACSALISVGHTRLAEKAGLKTDDLKYDGCKLLVKDKILYLLGRDYVPPKDAKPESTPDPNSGRPQGTIRAVTTFLEDVCGVRWYLPGPEGTFIPFVKELAVTDGWNKTVSPSLAFTNSAYDSPIAKFANNGRFAIKIQLFGGHSWPQHVSSKDYFKEHPEYFRIDESGKRNPDGNMLCTSNPDVRKIMVDKMRKSFDEGYDIIELGQSDGWAPCLCPECQRRYGDGKVPPSAEHPAERIWEMHKWIIDELAKSHPDKFVMPIIYGPTLFPSKLFDRLPENTIAEFASLVPWDKAWAGKFKGCTIYDAYIWEEDCVATCFVPAMDPVWLQQRSRLYREFGVIGLYGGGRGPSWGLGGPSRYAYAKLAADPDLNMDKLVSEYCKEVYGEAGTVMERFFKLFHSRSGKSLDGFMHNDRLAFENSYKAEDAFCALYPPAVVSRLDKMLRQAETKANGERAKGWLKHIRDEFDGLKSIAEMFAAKRAFELDPGKGMLLLVKAKVDSFEEWRNRIFSYSKDPEYLKRWFPQYPYLCNDLISWGNHDRWDKHFFRTDLVIQEVNAIVKGEKSVKGKGIGSALGRHEILEPITWNFEKMLAGLGNAASEKKLQVCRTKAKPGSDGALPPPAWLNVPCAAFEPYRAANSTVDASVSSTVRLLYDDERIYVRYECKEPKPENMKLNTLPRDGNVWGLDEVELFLNPECSNRKFMHFMAAPVKDAMYDERKGYIEDTLDPRYSSADIEWNTDWTYTFTVDRDNKRWTLDMAITFKSIGVKAPAEGTVWTANFARCRRAGGSEELSCWIPDDFGNPLVFGELIFVDKLGKTVSK